MSLRKYKKTAYNYILVTHVTSEKVLWPFLEWNISDTKVSPYPGESAYLWNGLDFLRSYLSEILNLAAINIQ